MRTFLVIVAAITQLQAADPRVGKWKQVPSPATADDPRRTMTISMEQDRVRVILPNRSTASRSVFTAKFDGRDYPVEQSPVYDAVALRRINGRTFEVTRKKDGRVLSFGRYEASRDGAELVMTNKVISPRGQFVEVWTRTGAKNPENLLVGEWTTDAGKTVRRSPGVLTITAVGANAVRYLSGSGMSYTAPLDGTESRPQNSRDDSVSVKVIDSRTVEETWKSNGRVGDVGRYVVSSDGREMTVTFDAVFADGATSHSVDVYRKQ